MEDPVSRRSQNTTMYPSAGLCAHHLPSPRELPSWFALCESTSFLPSTPHLHCGLQISPSYPNCVLIALLPLVADLQFIHHGVASKHRMDLPPWLLPLAVALHTTPTGPSLPFLQAFATAGPSS